MNYSKLWKFSEKLDGILCNDGGNDDDGGGLYVEHYTHYATLI